MEQIKILARENSFDNNEHKTQLKRVVLSSSFFNKNNMKNNFFKRLLQLSLVTSLVVVVSIILLALNPQSSESKFSILVKAEEALEEAIQNGNFYYRKTKISDNFNGNSYVTFQETWGETSGDSVRSIWYEENGYLNSELVFHNNTEFSCGGDCENKVEKQQNPIIYPEALIGEGERCDIENLEELNFENLTTCEQEIVLSSILSEFFTVPGGNSLEKKKELINIMKQSNLVNYVGKEKFNNGESFVLEINFTSKIKQDQKIYFDVNTFDIIGIDSDYHNGLTTRWELVENATSETPIINFEDYLK